MKLGKIIQKGAEANIVQGEGFVIKDRIAKGYRYPELDKAIRRRRSKREAKLLLKAGKLINVPKPFFVPDKSYQIKMPFIKGKKLSESLDGMKNWKEVCLEIGKSIGKLHDAGIIHGDLTTSNMIWVDKKNSPQLSSATEVDRARAARTLSQKGKGGDVVGFGDNVGGGGLLYFIDFGLGFGNGRVEDKAVDLHLIKQALEAKHFSNPENVKFSGPSTSKNRKEVEVFEEYWKEILKGYSGSAGAEKVMNQFRKVERRGRYKQQY